MKTQKTEKIISTQEPKSVRRSHGSEQATSHHPLVSVIIPTYNRKEWITECLLSLTNQSFPKNQYEIIVVDDGSTDGTEQVVRKFAGIQYIKQHNQGPGNARNHGAEQAQGTILAFTDDDCIPDKNWIEQGINALDISGLDGIEGETYTDKSKTTPLSVITYTYHGGGYMTANMFYKKKAFEAVNGFDTSQRMLFREDTDLAWRILDKGFKLGFSEQPRVYHRVINYGLIPFLKKHLRLREIWWNAKLCSLHPQRFRASNEMLLGLISTHTMYHYLFLTAAALSIITGMYFPQSTFLLSLVILIQNYILTVFLHTRMKSGIELSHVLRFKKEFALLCTVWWLAIFWDTFWKIAGNIRFRTFML